MNQPHNKPVAELKSGLLVASLWQNETEKGTRHNVTFSRLYKSEAGDWKRSENFGRDDLLVIAKLADFAHSKIDELIAGQKTP